MTPSNSGFLPAPPTPARGFFSNAWVYPLLACLLFLLLASFKKNIDYDMGIFLKAGQWIVQHHSIPQKDPFTFTVSDHDYLDMEWLYHAGCYLLFQVAGYEGLSLLHILLILAACGLTFLRMRAENPPLWTYGFLLFPTLIALETRFLARPEVLTWLLLVLDLWILDQRQARKRDYLFLLPFIQLLWVNTEGMFILGWVVMGAYLAGNGLAEKRLDPRLLKFFLISLAVSFLNPYFLKGVLFPLTLYTRVNGTGVFAKTIAEFQSPWLGDLNIFNMGKKISNLFVYRFLSPFLLLVIAATFRKRRLHELFLAGAFFYLSAMAIRNIPLFFYVALPLCAQAVPDLARSWTFARKTSEYFMARRVFAFGLTFVILLFCLRLVTGAASYPNKKDMGLGLNDQFLPIRAIQFMVDNRMDGQVLNNLGFGGWLSWLRSDPVFIDGRLEAVGEDFFENIYGESFVPGGLSSLCDQWNIRYIFLNPSKDTLWMNQLSSMPQWQLVYFDEIAAIYARAGARLPARPTRWEDRLQENGVDPAGSDRFLGDCLGLKPTGVLEGLKDWLAPDPFPVNDFLLARFAFANGKMEIARAFYVEALRRAPTNRGELCLEIGKTFASSGNGAQAQIFYKKAMELDPSIKLAPQH